MNKQKILKAGVIGASIITLLNVAGFNKSYAMTCNSNIPEEKVKYVNASLADINLEEYNASVRGISTNEYYEKNLGGRAEYDNRSLLFGSTDGKIVGGIQNGFTGIDVSSECNGVVQGLAKDKLVNGNIETNYQYNNGSTLFPNSSYSSGYGTPYQEILTNWKFPFLKESNGYYSFNSENYHVTRDYSANKFKLHEGARNGFYPFNNCQDDTFVNENKNLYFTAKFEIPFYMTTDGKVKNSETGEFEDMIFKFSGDDDVWIYVDDNLVVDLGGVHIKQDGNINFAKNEVWYSNVYNVEGNYDSYDVYRQAFSEGKLNQGKHTLKIFYMERAGGESNLFASFNLQSSGVEVNHIDKDTGNILSTEIKTGAIGTTITTNEKQFEDYRTYMKPENENIVLEENLQTVNYYYQKKHNLTVHYVDFMDKSELAEPIKMKLFEGEEYSTEEKVFNNYRLFGYTENVNGPMGKEDSEAYYEYIYTDSTITANYIDKTTGELLNSDVKTGTEGSTATFEEKEFDNYILVEKPESNDVVYTKKYQTIYYFYMHIGKVKVNYIDKSTGKNLDEVNIEGLEGDKVNSQEKKFENYILVKAPEKSEYILTREEQQANYYYIHQSNITVNYIDKDTNSLLDCVKDKVTEGSIYETILKEFENYKNIEKPEGQGVLIKKDDIIVNYYYQKLKFNLKVEMFLKNAQINDHYYELKGKVGKVEAEIKEANSSSSVKICYTIKVTNDQERKGSGILNEYIPDGYIALAEDNSGWIIDGNNISLNVDNINPGETKEFTFIITKNSDSDISTTLTNKVSVASKDLVETTLEDNEDSNDLVIMPRTGKQTIVYGIICAVLVAFGMLIKTHKI